MLSFAEALIYELELGWGFTQEACASLGLENLKLVQPMPLYPPLPRASLPRPISSFVAENWPKVECWNIKTVFFVESGFFRLIKNGTTAPSFSFLKLLTPPCVIREKKFSLEKHPKDIFLSVPRSATKGGETASVEIRIDSGNLDSWLHLNG